MTVARELSFEKMPPVKDVGVRLEGKPTKYVLMTIEGPQGFKRQIVRIGTFNHWGIINTFLKEECGVDIDLGDKTVIVPLSNSFTLKIEGGGFIARNKEEKESLLADNFLSGIGFDLSSEEVWLAFGSASYGQDDRNSTKQILETEGMKVITPF